MEKIILTKEQLEEMRDEKAMLLEFLKNVKEINENLRLMNENMVKNNAANQSFIQIIQEAFKKEKESKEEFIPVKDITGIPPYHVTDDHVSDIRLNECAKVLPEGATKKRIDWKVIYENLDHGRTTNLYEDGQLLFAGKGYIVLEASIENGKGDGQDFIKLFTISIE